MSNNTTSKIITVIAAEKKAEFENINETLSDIKLRLMFFIIIIIIVVLIKLTKACKRIYDWHKETIIRQNNRITPQL